MKNLIAFFYIVWLIEGTAQTKVTKVSDLAKANPNEVQIVDLQGIKSIPKEIYKFKNLKELSITMSSVKSIPHEIFLLNNLERLSFNQCSNIKYIPDSIGLLINLKYISFNMSNITSLPNSIGNLVKLEDLNLSYCRVKNFPDSFYKLPRLKSLSVGFREQEPPLFTETELAELKKKLPNCKVFY